MRVIFAVLLVTAVVGVSTATAAEPIVAPSSTSVIATFHRSVVAHANALGWRAPCLGNAAFLLCDFIAPSGREGAARISPLTPANCTNGINQSACLPGCGYTVQFSQYGPEFPNGIKLVALTANVCKRGWAKGLWS